MRRSGSTIEGRHSDRQSIRGESVSQNNRVRLGDLITRMPITHTYQLVYCTYVQNNMEDTVGTMQCKMQDEAYRTV